MGENTKKIGLLRKTSTTFLWLSVSLMVLSSVALYFYVRFLLQSEVEEELRSTEARIETLLNKDGTVFQIPPVLEIIPVHGLFPEKLKDTIIFDPSQNEMEEFRELSSFVNIKGTDYQITVRALIVESEDILIAIVISYFIMVALVFIFLFYFNNARNKRIWSPFFTNLEEMKNFSLTANKPIKLVESDILEFTELNTQIKSLTNQLISDYKNLKQFTEDVSHELQTPLAIIQAKIENVINDTNLDRKQYEQLTSIQKDILRLSNLNKRLALLTKIENQQFIKTELLYMESIVQECIENFNELFPDRFKLVVTGSAPTQMDPYLAAVLCNNLISNAIKYSLDTDDIELFVQDKLLMVCNTGNKPLNNPNKLFSRFYRETTSAKSTGLGLAIVHKICGLYGFTATYSFEQKKHIFKIHF